MITCYYVRLNITNIIGIYVFMFIITVKQEYKLSTPLFIAR